MGRQYNRLTATAVRTLKEPGRYRDGDGLMLQITKDGVKSWVLRYERDNRERWHGLGPVRLVSLAEAREKAAECRRMLREGKDPIAQRATVTARRMTFDEAVEAFLSSHEKTWRNDKHRQQWRSTLKAYAAPTLGRLPVAEIDAPLVARALKTIWHAKPETASRVRGRIEKVLGYAAAHGYRPKGDNPARWKDNLDVMLGTPQQTVEHHAALPYADLPAFMADLRRRDGLGGRALELTILTAARTGEIIAARWDEFDLDAGLWTVPAGRMKAKREHRVALSDAAIAVLRALPRTGALVFPGAKAGKPISNMTMTKVLRSMKRDNVTVHGFRSTFRDWAAETTGYPNHVVEMALAHTIPDKVEAAYRRGDLFAKRARLMADWAAFADSPVRPSAVTPIRSSTKV